ncbi:hypothetical protein DRP04_13310 [Archaeoglobales archaeon]|nr:MAG: hypothetical protein DRP04_13310 [Archaeoglobales archaeon]
MNPIEIFTKSSIEVSPSLIQFEIGCEIELFLYQCLKMVRKEYEHIFIISFFDAYNVYLNYLTRVFGDEVLSVIPRSNVISIFSKLEGGLEGSMPVIVGYIGKKLQKLEGRTLTVILGLDFYSVTFGEENLARLYPNIVNFKSYREDIDTLIAMNTEVFSERTIGIINNFSLNLAKLGLEERNGNIDRYIIIIRSIFPEYNLHKWYYKVESGKLTFYKG